MLSLCDLIFTGLVLVLLYKDDLVKAETTPNCSLTLFNDMSLNETIVLSAEKCSIFTIRGNGHTIFSPEPCHPFTQNAQRRHLTNADNASLPRLEIFDTVFNGSGIGGGQSWERSVG